jgi:hypothetical protein
MQKNDKVVTMKILEYVFEHYDIDCLEDSTVQAFEISVVSITLFDFLLASLYLFV